MYQSQNGRKKNFPEPKIERHLSYILQRLMNINLQVQQMVPIKEVIAAALKSMQIGS
jgi:hypothetical protein